ncbi:hypothetical protein [Amycolatopsis sp. YIM 10]|uniref:hypothetical protein n=1 Tax=Amycolatopsis sp. YIM 10 TaxID=2653857 RepID=UPI00129009D2|nr:hypothetical protein [Amycolatopsis sp. YIM 10]QFU92273.1 hypothetical protein YIM_35570 [Amycolatopsis sp. YIM 10]
MIALRVVRVFLIVAGLALAALGLIMIATEAKVSGGTVGVSWTCDPVRNANSGLRCNTDSGSYSGPGGLVNTLGWLGLPIGGVALIGAAIALGQFERPRGATVNPAMMPGRAPAQPGRAQGGVPPATW